MKNKRRVFIVGGGTSVKGIDFNLLKDEDIIATNWSAKHIPSPTYFLTADSGVILKAANATTKTTRPKAIAARFLRK